MMKTAIIESNGMRISLGVIKTCHVAVSENTPSFLGRSDFAGVFDQN